MGKVLKVREVGDPILITKCEEVDTQHIDKAIIEIIEDMKETKKNCDEISIRIIRFYHISYCYES